MLWRIAAAAIILNCGLSSACAEVDDTSPEENRLHPDVYRDWTFEIAPSEITLFPNDPSKLTFTVSRDDLQMTTILPDVEGPLSKGLWRLKDGGTSLVVSLEGLGLPPGYHEVRLLGRADNSRTVPERTLRVHQLGEREGLDPSFGTEGVLVDALPMWSSVWSIQPTADGHILLAGGGFVGRLDAAGKADPAFGNAGVVELPLVATDDRFAARALAVDSRGRIVAAGERHPRLVRLLANGELDTGFGASSFVMVGDQSLKAVAIDARGRILVSGQDRVSRFLEDGSPDTSFATSGSFVVPKVEPPAYITDAPPFLFALGPAEGVTLARFGQDRAVITRLTSEGALDSTFGAGGVASFSGIKSSPATSLQVAPDGGVSLLGIVRDPGQDSSVHNVATVGLVKFRPDGTPDLGFGTQGQQLLPVPVAVKRSAYGGGKFYGVGLDPNVPHPIEDRWAVSRFTSDGKVDPTFGREGLLLTIFKERGMFAPRLATVQADGKLLVGGEVALRSGSGPSLVIVRYR